MLKITFNLEAGQQLTVKGQQMTLRESEVAKYIVEGQQNKGIARILNISANTVKIYTQRCFKKAGCSDRYGLVAELMREHYNLVSVHEEDREGNVVSKTGATSYVEWEQCLKDKEKEVLSEIIKGKSSKAISEKLGITNSTARGYMLDVTKKLDLNRLQVIAVLGSLHHK